jgi:hypothetical protein
MSLYHLIKLNKLLEKIKENNDFHWSVTDDSIIVTDADSLVYVFSIERKDDGT